MSEKIIECIETKYFGLVSCEEIWSHKKDLSVFSYLGDEKYVFELTDCKFNRYLFTPLKAIESKMRDVSLAARNKGTVYQESFELSCKDFIEEIRGKQCALGNIKILLWNICKNYYKSAKAVEEAEKSLADDIDEFFKNAKAYIEKRAANNE